MERASQLISQPFRLQLVIAMPVTILLSTSALALQACGGGANLSQCQEKDTEYYLTHPEIIKLETTI